MAANTTQQTNALVVDRIADRLSTIPSTGDHEEHDIYIDDNSEHQHHSSADSIHCLPPKSEMFDVEEMLAVPNGTTAAFESSHSQWKSTSIKVLLRAFETRACLWNNKLDIFMNRQIKLKALEEVDEIMIKFGLTRSAYRKKWTIMRGQFFRELGRERKSTRGFVSQWKWYKGMSFLTECSDIESKLSDSSMETFPASMVEPFHRTQVDVMDHQLPKSTSTPVTVSPQLSSSFAVAEMPQTRRGESFIKMQTTNSGIWPSPNRATPPQHEEKRIMGFYNQNEETIFGLMVSKTLQRLGPMQRALAKKKISDVLYEVEISSLQAGNNVHNTETSFHSNIHNDIEGM